MSVEFIDPRMGSEIVAEELEDLKRRIIANMQAAKAVATGNTIRSLHVEQRPFGASLVSQQKMPFGVLETGRRAGKVPMGFGEIIYRWMQAKGIHSTRVQKPKNPWIVQTRDDQERADRSMAYAIATTIRKHGSSLYRAGGRDTIYTKEIPVTIERVRERLGMLMKAFVVGQIKATIPKR